MNRIKELKITTLGDNLVYQEGHGQAGLVLLLEFIDARGMEKKVLFDTGDNKEATMHNIKFHKLALDEVDCIVLSHGHMDHTGATVEILKDSGGMKVYGHPHTFIPRYVKRKERRGRNIGVPEGEGMSEIEEAGGEVVLSTDPVEVLPGLWTTGEIERKTFETVIDLPSGGKLVIDIEGEEREDLVLDDLALWADVEEVGPFVVTGCAHAGSINTVHHVKRLGSFNSIHGLVGGTHMLWRTDEYVKRTINEMKSLAPRMISPCHCTGWKATTWFWEAFPEEFILNYCYRVIEAGKRPERQLF